MWFLANSSIWHRKMLLNLTIPHPTTSLNVFLSQFPSFSSCLEQRTVRNTRGPFLVLFSFMKEQVFVPKTPNICAIMTGPPSTIVHSGFKLWFREKKKYMAYDLHPVLIPYLVSQNSSKLKYFNEGFLSNCDFRVSPYTPI